MAQYWIIMPVVNFILMSIQKAPSQATCPNYCAAKLNRSPVLLTYYSSTLKSEYFLNRTSRPTFALRFDKILWSEFRNTGYLNRCSNCKCVYVSMSNSKTGKESINDGTLTAVILRAHVTSELAKFGLIHFTSPFLYWDLWTRSNKFGEIQNSPAG